MTSHHQTRSGRTTTWILAILILTSIGGAAWALTPGLWKSLTGSASDKAPRNLVLDQVKKGPFLVSLSVQGSLDSQNNVTLTSKVEGTTTIISIVPEGKWVTAGEVVCELDASVLREEARTQEITVTEAEATLLTAREQLEIQKTLNQSDIAAADLAWELSKLDLEKYNDGEYLQQNKQLSGDVVIALEEQVRNEELLKFTQAQVRLGYATQSELEAARIALRQSGLKVDNAKEALKVLENYTHRRTMAELTANVTELDRALQRVKLTADSLLTQKTSDVKAATLTYDVQNEKLKRLQSQIKACTLVAPQDGEVVYATGFGGGGGGGGGGGRRSEPVVIEEGASVREQQQIINLPDVSKMKVECRIHESLIGMVRRGLRARIRVDADPNKIFNGQIVYVSSVPMSGSFPNTDLREYSASVHLTDDSELVKNLRPGLTAQIEILVDNRNNVLQVPVQAVVNVVDQQIAYTLDSNRQPVQRSVKVGQTNQSHLEILEGLAEGDVVVLNPRTQFSGEISLLEAELNAIKAKEEEKLDTTPILLPEGAGENGAQGGGRGRNGRGRRGAGGPGAPGGPGAGGDAGGGGVPRPAADAPSQRGS